MGNCQKRSFQHTQNWVMFMVMVLLLSCQSTDKNYYTLSGPAMGTSYNITVQYDDPDELQKEINLILDEFNMSLSTYWDISRISQFNRCKDSLVISLQEDTTFLPMLTLSKEVYHLTNGAFDPTVMPLLHFYGFGPNPIDPEEVNVEELDSVRALVGYDKISWYTEGDRLVVKKSLPGIQLDFNSIAKGYGVDLIAAYLDGIGIKNYLVEIGGEVHVQGISQRGKDWMLGINTPDANASLQSYELPVSLHNEAMATSGNYRNFYERDGKKYVHIVDPVSGENHESDIASASIIADQCALADALATASIVLGSDKAMQLLNAMDNIRACLIVPSGEKLETIFTDNFENK